MKMGYSSKDVTEPEDGTLLIIFSASMSIVAQEVPALPPPLCSRQKHLAENAILH